MRGAGGGRSRGARTAATVVLALTLAACGSTVQVGTDAGSAPLAVAPQDGGQPAAVADQGLTLEPSTSADGVAAGTSTAGTTVFGPSGQTSTSSGAAGSAPQTAAGPAGPSGSGQTSAPSTQPSAGGPAARGTYGPGVTDDELVIGVAIPDEQSTQANQQLLGASGITVGNIERYYDIMAEFVNDNGGIAGRVVRYSKFRYSTAQGENYSQLEQAACAHWTQDDPALIAPAITGSDNMLGCAYDRGLATWTSTLTGSDDRTYATYPTHIELSAIGLTRQGRLLADGLESSGYFDEGYKLGVVTFDGPQWHRAVDESFEPALARHGRAITEKAYVRELQSNAQVGDLTAEIQSVVLQFKTQGITHVVFIDERAVMAILFTRSAENQAYRPRYGLTSQAGNTALAGLAPQGQLERAVGIGWIPNFDVPQSERPEDPAVGRCLALFEQYGERPADANNRAVMLSACENISFVKAAVEAGLPDITAASLARGAETLGAFPSLNSLGNYLGPGRHDAGSHYRTVAYDAGCNCFHYTSDAIADLPR